MKLNNTFLFENVTDTEAMELAINEMFNKEAGELMLDNLVVNGSMGTSEYTRDWGTVKSQCNNVFVVSTVSGTCFKRVEHFS